MRRWQRAIAVLLMIVFAPATVLAAMPLELCLGADGHRAIESALFDHHPIDAHHDQTTPYDDPDGTSKLEIAAPCIDFALAASAGPLIRQIAIDSDAVLSDSKLKQFRSQPGQFVVEATGHGTVRSPFHILRSSPDQFLAALATVVLLN